MQATDRITNSKVLDLTNDLSWKRREVCFILQAADTQNLHVFILAARHGSVCVKILSRSINSDSCDRLKYEQEPCS